MTTKALRPDPDTLLFIPLGGSNEIGMNLNLYHYQGEWLMIDCGMGFADDYLPGVDLVLPDIDFVHQIHEQLAGLVLTHAHEDHIGAIPYLWEEFGCPIYATPFTANVVRTKLSDCGISHKGKVHEIDPGSTFKLGGFDLEFVPITHSIPEMNAVAIRTDHGTVLHTGDWKLDPEPLVGAETDHEALVRYGKEGVLALVCDSTNVFESGESGSEAEVRRGLVETVGECPKRVFVTTFASNVARLDSICHAAREAGRKVALAGRSLWRITRAAQESGYLKDLEFLTDKQGMALPAEEVLFIVTGCQGEPRAALPRIASDNHPAVRMTPDDTVIFSSRTIPGNETAIGWVHNRLVRRGIRVVTDKDAMVHVSGHPARDELERMYEWARPTIAVPVHGEPRHLQEHCKLAHLLGAKESVEGHNGAAIRLAPGAPEIVDIVDSGYYVLDGTSIIPADSPVIRMRRRLRDDGVVLVSVAVDKDGALRGEPQIHAPGVLDKDEDKDLLKVFIEEIADTAAEVAARETKPGKKKKPPAGSTVLQDNIRATVRRICKRELGKKPVMKVHVHREGEE